jgi:hypothetical protein
MARGPHLGLTTTTDAPRLWRSKKEEESDTCGGFVEACDEAADHWIEDDHPEEVEAGKDEGRRPAEALEQEAHVREIGLG